MKFHASENVKVRFPEAALSVIFDECDRFDQDETGGRVIGTFETSGDHLTLNVKGTIESGPHALRTPVSFFQDGKHQERVFRRIERSHPEIEHLGNWHTHHVNGLSRLSDGDVDTYRRTVQHHNHNIPFFYAMLVVAKNKSTKLHQRYDVKHYIFRRDDDRAYEIPSRMVEVVTAPILWPVETEVNNAGNSLPGDLRAKAQRVYDRDILGEFYREVHPFTSAKLGLYWRGSLELLDGSKMQVVVVENASPSGPSYSIVVREVPSAVKAIADQLAARDFPSARAALIATERLCNRALYEGSGHSHETTSRLK